MKKTYHRKNIETHFIKIGLLTIVGLLPWLCNSQNLVPNQSFEEFGVCKGGSWNLQDLQKWYNPLLISSPDYYNSCAPDSSSGVPVNGGGVRFPKTGGGFVGLFCSQQFYSQNVRDYISVRLMDGLYNGKRYYVSYFCNLADISQQSISTLGVYFSASDTIPSLGAMLIASPKVENNINIQLVDTFGWMKIKGSFVANGTEKYITIGNFKDDAHCGLTDLPAGQGLYKCAYYLIDDVTVSLNPADCGIDTTGMFLGVEGVDKETINIYPNPTQDKLYIQSEAHLLSYYTIADIAGNVVQQGDVAGHEISVGDLAKGVYFVRLQGKDGAVYVRKMLKE